MTGHLRIEKAGFEPGKHDHLVLFQRKQALVFRDARMFGRVKFSVGKTDPEWWSSGPPECPFRGFYPGICGRFPETPRPAPHQGRAAAPERLPGHRKLDGGRDPLAGPPRSRAVPPAISTARKPAPFARKRRAVCQAALKTVGHDFADPPDGWLFHERWKRKGECPRDGLPLETAQIGGRTTRWCAMPGAEK